MTNPKVPIPVMTEYGRSYFVYTSMEEELRHEFQQLKYTNYDELCDVRDEASEQNLDRLTALVEEVMHQYRLRRQVERDTEALGERRFWSGLTLGVAMATLACILIIWWKTHAQQTEGPSATATTCQSLEAPGYAYSCLHEAGDAAAAHGEHDLVFHQRSGRDADPVSDRATRSAGARSRAGEREVASGTR